MKALYYLLPIALGLVACSGSNNDFFSSDLKEDCLHGKVKSITVKTTQIAEEPSVYIDWAGIEYTKEYNQNGHLVKLVNYNDRYKKYGEIVRIRTDYYYDGDMLSASAVFNCSNPNDEYQTQYTEYTYDEQNRLVRELSNVLRDGAVYPRQKDYTYENGKLVREEDLLAMYSRDVAKYRYPDEMTTVKKGMSFSQFWDWPSYEWKEADEESLDRMAIEIITKRDKKGRIISIQRGEDKLFCSVKYGKTGDPSVIKNGLADGFNHISDKIYDDNPVGFKYEYEFDKKGNWVKRTEYDAQGKVEFLTERKIQYYE